MTHDELLADLTDKHNYHIGEHTQVVSVSGCNTCEAYYALRAVVEICANRDFVTIGDISIFNSGRNLVKEEIIQAIEEQIK